MSKERDNTQEPNEQELQALLQQDSDAEMQAFDPDQSLRRVLSRAKQQTATRDIFSFFMSWIWLLFAGFGASMYGASQRRHPPARRRSTARAGQSKPSDQ